MASEYLGKVNGVITSEQLDNLISVGGTSLVTGDITWLWFKKENKNILLADRKISKQSWDAINSAGCKDGKSININNTECVCRIMSGATKDPYENTGTDAGGEWNEFIVNLVPDNSISNWNFGGVAEWCKERASSSLNSAWALSRGNSSVTNFANAQRTALIGFRPLLEVNNTSPTFDVISTDIGDVTNVEIPYVVTDLENDNFTLIEKIDGNTIRTLYSQQNGSSYILDLSSIWDDLTYGKHTIEIVADDCKLLGKSTVSITFKKIKQPITTLPITSNLKQAIDHSKEIKKEIEYQSLKLKNNLVAKGVECSDTDKMSRLIDIVGNIELGKKWASGTVCKTNAPAVNFNLVSNGNRASSYVDIPLLEFTPSILILIATKTTSGVSLSILIYDQFRGENTVKVSSYNGYYQDSTSYDFLADSIVFQSDKIRIPVSNNGSSEFEWVAFE